MKTRRIKFTATAARWFDRVNGNTYHSVRITRHRDCKTICCPFQYGYGDQYRYTALEAMARAKWLPPKYRKPATSGGLDVWAYERENNHPILWTVSDGLKRDCVTNGRGS